MSSSSSNKPTFSISSNPLFSTLLSFAALILLNLPRLLWRILLSPPLLLTGILFLSLLRLAASQQSLQRRTTARNIRSQIESEISAISFAAASEVSDPSALLSANRRSIQCRTENRKNRSQIAVAIKSKQSAISAVEIESNQSESSSAVGSDGGASSAVLNESFVKWSVRAPLEVIREEEYENEASNESDEPEPRLDRVGLDRHPSLAMCYPETDSDDSSDGGWPETTGDDVFVTWDEDELIEISLEKKVLGFELELEDNLIEIDISPTRNAGEFADEV